ncbi:MAG: hypothetical protein WCP60_02660 [bacterium]
MNELLVQSGAVIALRLFDIAYSIDLTMAEDLWGGKNGGATTRSKLNTTPAKAVAFDVPPVLLSLGTLPISVDGNLMTATATARLYDFGVVAFSLKFPVASLSWKEFSDFANTVDWVIGPNVETDLWIDMLSKIKDSLAPAITRPNQSNLQEDHLIAVVHQWNRPLKGVEIFDKVDLVPLLSGEKRTLSEGATRDLLRQRFSYYEDDLVVLTWDRAFIYEPRSDSDVADILEVANAQLLELRYYDELLDDELPRMYDLVEQTHRAANLLAPRRFANLARKLYTLVAEVTELTERADNVLQVTEDVYLARVYSAALELFRVRMVGAAVDRKLSIVRDTYAALYAEASDARGELLEIAIVILIILELAVALMRHV